MTNTYIITKKIHRLLVLIISTLGLIMAITGIIMKYPDIAHNILGSINLGQVRNLHNKLSPIFSIALFLMALTGLWMYVYPSLAAWRRRRQPPANSSDETL
ncbi:MAG: hypothetical protein HZC01_02470 [Candidatus Kerfeldbacteria bacterium]|nr:hypothetical protein [Candidatus Kerfeldbacteria bacterium]